MDLTIVPIALQEDATQEIYASEDAQNLLKMWKSYYPTIGFHEPWVGYTIRHQGSIVGCCAFNGSPKENRVEVSYWTFKEFEGKGISTFACKTLVDLALATAPQVEIFAKTAPEENASCSILRKNGFVFSGIVQDEEIGDAWEWIFKP
jgi:RimJ/RimL family protein N-acetyltransferase